jgi:hypothetical protein
MSSGVQASRCELAIPATHVRPAENVGGNMLRKGSHRSGKGNELLDRPGPKQLHFLPSSLQLIGQAKGRSRLSLHHVNVSGTGTSSGEFAG